MNFISKYIKRDKSCLTNSSNFESLVKVKKFPVFFGVTDKKIEDDLYAEMEWFIEPETGLIQLNNLIPLDILYQEQHAYGFGKTWEDHYQEFSKFILKTNPSQVMEIGAGQGRIAEITSSSDKIISWTIIEPNPTFRPTEKIQVIEGFFDENYILEDSYDTYTFSHVLEHAYNPSEFLKCIWDKMRLNDNLIFSYPNLSVWLDKKFTNSLNFEHTIFLTKPHLVTLVENLGFEIVKIKSYLEHSHFFHLKKKSTKIQIKNYSNLYEINKSLLLKFIQYHYDEVNSINSKIKELDGEVFLFGAHIFSQYLTVFGLETENIKYILDNSVQKHDKRLYGTNLKTKSPKILKNYDSPTVILRAGPYNQEIKNDIIKNINANTKFI